MLNLMKEPNDMESLWQWIQYAVNSPTRCFLSLTVSGNAEMVGLMIQADKNFDFDNKREINYANAMLLHMYMCVLNHVVKRESKS